MKAMKANDLKIGDDTAETNESAPPSGNVVDSPNWYRNVSSAVRLLHESFSAIRAGVIPILLVCFLFLPSALAAGLGVFTSSISNLLKVLADNGQSVTIKSTELSLTSPQKKIVEDALAKTGQAPATTKDGLLTLTETQLKAVGNELDIQKKVSDGNEKILDSTNSQIAVALSAINNPKRGTDTGWAYLGRADNNRVWQKAETVSNTIAVADLKEGTAITFTDNVYLRTETKNCSRSTGEIITALQIGETATLLGDAQICPDTGSVWVKIRRNG